MKNKTPKKLSFLDENLKQKIESFSALGAYKLPDAVIEMQKSLQIESRSILDRLNGISNASANRFNDLLKSSFYKDEGVQKAMESLSLGIEMPLSKLGQKLIIGQSMDINIGELLGVPSTIQNNFSLAGLEALESIKIGQHLKNAIEAGILSAEIPQSILDLPHSEAKKLIGNFNYPQTLEGNLGKVLLNPRQPSILLTTEIISRQSKTTDGHIIEVIALPWLKIYEELKLDPDFLFNFTKYSLKFEEFIAAAYSAQGDHVILTPGSNDKGVDVIVENKFGKFRIIEQCKAYSPHRKVSRNDVDALITVLKYRNKNAQKAILTTTSEFAPFLLQDELVKSLYPDTLELRNGFALMKWLAIVVNKYLKN